MYEKLTSAFQYLYLWRIQLIRLYMFNNVLVKLHHHTSITVFIKIDTSNIIILNT